MSRGKRHNKIAAIVPISDCDHRSRPAVVPTAPEPEDAGPDNSAPIPADVVTDDSVVSAEFDALPWFEQASDSEIYDLIEIEYGGDYAADNVALWFENREPDVDAVLDYSRKGYGGKDLSGFECHVSSEEAEEWIRQHKPGLLHEETARCEKCRGLVLVGEGHFWPQDDANPDRLCDDCYDETMQRLS